MYNLIRPLLIVYAIFVICAPFGSRIIADRQFSGQSSSAAEIIKTAAVQQQLQSGEKILWSSNVDGNKTVNDAMPVAFIGIIFALAPILMTFGINRANRPPVLLVIFMLPFISAALYMVTCPYWARMNALKSVCMLTDRRALRIINGWIATNTKYTSHVFITPELDEYNSDKDRSNLIFYKEHSNKAGFDGINNGDTAIELLKEKLAEADPDR